MNTAEAARNSARPLRLLSPSPTGLPSLPTTMRLPPRPVAAISAATLPQARRAVYNELKPSAAASTSAIRTAARSQREALNASAFDYDPQLDDEMTIPSGEIPRSVHARAAWMMIAAVVGGVAVLGGIGAFALSFGDSGGSGFPLRSWSSR